MAEKQQARVVAVHDNHGQSVASWTAVSIIALGALIGTIASVANKPALYVASAIVVVLGAITGKVLAAMGFGVSGRPGH
jgi:nucleoside recognition membrane protein YjiH